MPPPTRTTLSGRMVLAVVFGLALFIVFGVTTVAMVTRRPPAPPPMPRHDAPVTAPSRSAAPSSSAAPR